MPIDCLPERLRDVENHFKDDSQYIGIPIIGKLYYWWEKKTKGWFAVGNAANRSKYKWANWREFPKVLYAYRGYGKWRFENTNGSLDIDGTKIRRWIFNETIIDTRHWIREARDTMYYLSRTQYWCDWHIGLQWPLFFHSHYKNWQFYVGLKRDGDQIYWLSLYLGRCWK